MGRRQGYDSEYGPARCLSPVGQGRSNDLKIARLIESDISGRNNNMVWRQSRLKAIVHGGIGRFDMSREPLGIE